MNILFLITHPIQNASSRYCVYQFIPDLEAAGHRCVVRPFSTTSLFQTLHLPDHAMKRAFHAAWCAVRRLFDLLEAERFDLVFIHREAFPFFSPVFEMLVLSRNSKVVLSFDDAVYAGHGDSHVHSESFLYRFKYGSGLNKVMERSIHVIAGNAELARHAAQFHRSVSILPTVVDMKKFVPRRSDDPNDRALVIGWYGSESTSSYLHEIEAVLQRIAQKHADYVRFRFHGAPSLKLHLPNCEYLPFRLESEIHDLQQIDIGLMPMPDTPWTRGKCAFKAIQYMAVGGVAVVSPIGAAAELVEDGVNGFHASGNQQWYSVLDRLIADAKLRADIGVRARQTITTRYSLQVWGPRFTKLLEDIAATTEPIPGRVWMDQCA